MKACRCGVAGALLPLLLSGCGFRPGEYGDDGRLPPAPSAPQVASTGYDSPSPAAYPQPAPPAYAPPPRTIRSAAPPQDEPADVNSYRTADGVVHVIPRASAAAPVEATPPPAPEPYVAQPVQSREPIRAADGPSPALGPQGSSRPAPGEERYDTVGYAGVRSVGTSGPAAMTAVVAVHPTLPAGSVVELTSLDTGHTILALVTATMPVASGEVIDISPGAARQLGVDAQRFGVRVRRVVASAGDLALLRAGQPAGQRIDAPPVLLAGLRHSLGGPAQQPITEVALPPSSASAQVQTYVAPTISRPPVVRVVRPAPAPAVRGGYFVQVAALSTSERAQALAQSIGGSVRPGGRLFRVQLGPYRTSAEAERARASIAARGYRDAVIVDQP